MIDRQTVFEIHRLKHAGYSTRHIAVQMRLGRDTVRKYLEQPECVVVPKKPRSSKLDTHKEHPRIQAPVVLQRLQEKGF